MSRSPGQPRSPGGGFKKKIARLEARLAELEQENAELKAELRSREGDAENSAWLASQKPGNVVMGTASCPK